MTTLERIDASLAAFENEVGCSATLIVISPSDARDVADDNAFGLRAALKQAADAGIAPDGAVLFGVPMQIDRNLRAGELRFEA